MLRHRFYRLQMALFALRRFLPAAVRQSLRPLYRRWWRRAAHRQLAAAHRQRAPRAAAGYALVCLPLHDWTPHPQRPQLLLTRLAAAGHPVLYLRPDFQPNSAPSAGEALAPNVTGLRLPGPAGLSLNRLPPTAAQVEQWLEALATLPVVAQGGEVVCLVQAPGWGPLALAARERWGWKIVYDGPAVHALLAPTLLALHAELVSASDRVLAAGQGLTLAQLAAAVQQVYARVSIVIVSYHNLEYLQLCLESVWAKTDYPNYDVTVVDNGSPPVVLAYLRSCQAQHPNLRVIANDANLGFAHANNLGLAATSASAYVVLLNNDTVVTAGWLSGLLRPLARDPRLGMVGPVTNWTSNEARVTLPYADLAGMEAAAQTYTQAHRGQLTPVKMLNLFCVALRRSVVDQIGPLDEAYGPGLFEDDDYAMRLQQAGYGLAYVPDVYVHHWGWASFGQLPQADYDRLFETNRRRFEAKWGQPWQRPPLKLM